MSIPKASDLFDFEKTIAKELFKNRNYPWEVLPDIKDFIASLGKTDILKFVKQFG